MEMLPTMALIRMAFGAGMLCWRDSRNFISSDLFVWIEHDKGMYKEYDIYHF